MRQFISGQHKGNGEVLTDNTHGAPTIGAGSSTDAHPFVRLGLARGVVDRRTREWRRRRELVDIFAQALGGHAALTPVMTAKVLAAAELAVTAELTRVRFMAGKSVTADDVVRTANQAARAEKALGIKLPSKEDGATPSIDWHGLLGGA